MANQNITTHGLALLIKVKIMRDNNENTEDFRTSMTMPFADRETIKSE